MIKFVRDPSIGIKLLYRVYAASKWPLFNGDSLGEDHDGLT